MILPPVAPRMRLCGVGCRRFNATFRDREEDLFTMKTRVLACAFLIAVIGWVAAPVVAQTDAPAEPEKDGITWRAGIRFGDHDFTEAEQSVDAVFGGDSASMVGVQLEAQFSKGFFLGLSYESGDVSGKRVVLIPNAPPIQTNIDETLDIEPLRVTAGWMFRKDEAWAPVVGAGLTSLSWSEEGGGESVSGSDTGYHLMGGIRYQRTRFSIGGEIEMSSASGSVGEGGVTQFFGEDDLGGTSIHLVALFHF